MSHKPMVRSERPIKPPTMDRLHKKAHDAVSKPSPSIPASTRSWTRG
jgi:hypothetical protein